MQKDLHSEPVYIEIGPGGPSMNERINRRNRLRGARRSDRLLHGPMSDMVAQDARVSGSIPASDTSRSIPASPSSFESELIPPAL